MILFLARIVQAILAFARKFYIVFSLSYGEKLQGEGVEPFSLPQPLLVLNVSKC